MDAAGRNRFDAGGSLLIRTRQRCWFSPDSARYEPSVLAMQYLVPHMLEAFMAGDRGFCHGFPAR
ncbi:DUF2274 domain-containing protein [Pseudomonas aeruginosa]|nr:DUF2274 domain-containing protein [Pseudomonas aeruginosa]HCF3395438.1 DUF2274 domain-containing protein [Pseudomonas aeruginosa]HEJ2267316.1 DUF2274 domain-containing protein [Pseudomonas aeruginosa]